LSKVATAGALFFPSLANAAAGESPRFSVFGIIGDGTSMSEGAAYGSDQSQKVYSPYSVYGEASDKSLYVEGRREDYDRRRAILAETQKRLSFLPRYIQRKEWFNVKDELTRYMYETRGAVRGLAQTPLLKEKATTFFKAIEETNTNATLKRQDECAKAQVRAVEALNDFYESTNTFPIA